MSSQKDTPGELTMMGFMFVGFAFFAWGLLLVVAQTLYWLKNGDWFSPLAVVLFLDHPKGMPWVMKLIPSLSSTGLESFLNGTDYRGVAKMVAWVLERELTTVTTLAGILFTGVALLIAMAAEK